MNYLIASVLAFLSLVSLANGVRAACAVQGQFDLCKLNLDTFMSDTCLPLQAKNATLYASCQCYYWVHLQNDCYSRCTDDSELTLYSTSTVQPSITSTCSAANLDPARLPAAPWQEHGLTTATTATTTAAASGTATGGASTTTTTTSVGGSSNAKTNGAEKSSFFSSFAAILVAVVAMCFI